MPNNSDDGKTISDDEAPEEQPKVQPKKKRTKKTKKVKKKEDIETESLEVNKKKRVKKKRGRKPTGKIATESEPVKNEEEYIIVHLPIQFEDGTEMPKKKPKKKRHLTSNKIFNSDLCNNDEVDCENCLKLHKHVDELKTIVLELKENLAVVKESRMKNTKAALTNVNFYNMSEGKTVCMEETDIACWWCCHQFDSIPCSLPEKYYDGIFYVWGCFCSYSCAMSYNNDLDDYKTSERNSLIQFLYKTIYDVEKQEELVKAANPRQSLKFFGGSMSIEKFRKDSTILDKNNRFILPPMMSIVPMIEEDYRDKNRYEYRSKKNVPLNAMRVIKANQNLKKRSNPLPNSKFSLIETMGLQRKKKSVI